MDTDDKVGRFFETQHSRPIDAARKHIAQPTSYLQRFHLINYKNSSIYCFVDVSTLSG